MCEFIDDVIMLYLIIISMSCCHYIINILCKCISIWNYKVAGAPWTQQCSRIAL